MVQFDKIFTTDEVSVLLITSKYESAYKEKDFNPLPAISFPMKSCFEYKAGKFKTLLNNNLVLFEKPNIKYEVSKFKEFKSDVTVTFQFQKSDSQLFEELTKYRQDVRLQKRTPRTEVLLNSFLSDYLEHDKVGKEQLVINIIEEVLSNSSLASKEGSNLYSIKKIEIAKEYIHSFYYENITIADIAAVSNLSQYHFSRLFKLITGLSPYDYLISVRIERAKQLLRNNLPITQIAFSVGFNSLENFSHSFRKTTDISPTDFRNSKISKTF